MFEKHDMPSHPFFRGHGHFHHNDFSGTNRFNKEPFKSKESGMKNGNFNGQDGPHFFAGKGGDHGGERFFRRGDIKIVLLKLLQEQPRHGYELIKVLEERFKGFYSPSPGSVYPTLQMLEDQDFINVTKEGRKKVYHLTDEGQVYLDKNQNEDPLISRMNRLENLDLDEMQTLRSDIQGLFHEFFMIGRQAMDNPQKKEQLQKLLEKTRAELLKIADDDKKNTEE